MIAWLEAMVYLSGAQSSSWLGKNFGQKMMAG